MHDYHPSKHSASRLSDTSSGPKQLIYSKEQNEKLPTNTLDLMCTYFSLFFAIYNLEGEAIFNDFLRKRYQCFIGSRFN